MNWNGLPESWIRITKAYSRNTLNLLLSWNTRYCSRRQRGQMTNGWVLSNFGSHPRLPQASCFFEAHLMSFLKRSPQTASFKLLKYSGFGKQTYFGTISNSLDDFIFFYWQVYQILASYLSLIFPPKNYYFWIWMFTTNLTLSDGGIEM